MRHAWRDSGPLKHCKRCGATKRGKGDKLQFILPYRPGGWTPEASWTPPCTGARPACDPADGMPEPGYPERNR
jgi:hypothetical protein